MANRQAYQEVLRDLYARLESTKQAIAAIEALMPAQPETLVVGSSEVAMRSFDARPLELPTQRGRFSHSTIADAAVSLLRESKEPRHVSELVSLLEDGGLVLKSEDKANTVGSILNRRHRNEGDVVRVGRGTWAIAEPFNSVLFE